MALTTLLNSLHSHLQTQTQLLPTLHAQLGLPPTALEDELKTLQEQLIQGVERQIDLRRKQVDEWMGKCEEVESICMRYTKALGGNTKATGSSLGEIRKELSLPRRYELVAEFQEKLRQAYHAKLEQLTTLMNRISTLSRTLGTEFFAQGTLETFPSTNDAVVEVTPERFLRLEKELVRGKAEVTKRLHQLTSIFVQIDWLYTELGIQPPSSDGSSSPPSSMATDDPFCVSTPTPASRTPAPIPLLFQDTNETEYERTFAKFSARLEEMEGEEVPQLQGVEPTEGILEWAAALQTNLEDVKQQREAHIQAMYDQLEGLWRRLGVDEAAMDSFVEMHRGSREETIRQYEEELDRMLELKQERMGQFIESAREEITKLWNDLMVGAEEKADFAPFADDEFTEELLAIHEEEIKKLKEERRMKAPLLASIKKYFTICDEEKELLAAASDQTRLLGRGRDPGRLLREEKMRKRVQKEKPRLEQDLLASIPSWELEAGKPFLVHGESVLQLLQETIASQEQESSKRRSTRSGSVPARSTTPGASSSGHAPNNRTGAVTPAVRPRSAMASSSRTGTTANKRQKLGDSTSSMTSNSTSTGQRVPLSSRRGNSGGRAQSVRPGSPTSRQTKTPGNNPPSSMQRPGSSVAMPVPRHAVAGAGFSQARSTSHGSGVPPSVRGSASTKRFYSTGAPGTMPGSSRGTVGAARALKVTGKTPKVAAAKIVAKAERARRESFKPRPSLDHLEAKKGVGPGGKYGGQGVGPAVDEEEED